MYNYKGLKTPKGIGTEWDKASVLRRRGQFTEQKRKHCRQNLIKRTGYVLHQQFNIQQLYALSTLYLYVLYLSDNKQRLVPPLSLTETSLCGSQLYYNTWYLYCVLIC